MRDGQIAQLAAPAALLRNPADDFVRQFVGGDRAMRLLKLAVVRDLTDRRVTSARRDTPVDEARRAMAAAGADTLIVTGPDGTFDSVVHVRDLDGRTGTLTGIPSRPHPTAAADESLHDAMSRMLTGGVAWLPVVDGGNRFDGVITMTAFARLMGAASAAPAG